MRDHESAVQKALIAHLRADAGVRGVLGHPARVWDAAPRGAGRPHLLIGRCESRPVAADGCGVEQLLTLNVVSGFDGTEEAKAVVAAVRAALADAVLAADGVRTVSLGVRFCDVFTSPDRRRVWGVMRVRAVTEEWD